MKKILAGLLITGVFSGVANAAPPTVPLKLTPPAVHASITKYLMNCGAKPANIRRLQVQKIPFRPGGLPTYFLPLEGTACDEQGASPMSMALSFEPTATATYKMEEVGGARYLSNKQGLWIYTSVGCDTPPLDHAQAFIWDAAKHRVKAASPCLGEKFSAWLTSHGFH